MERISQRQAAQTREITFETNVNCHAEGSCIVSCGQTKILCTATIEHKVPKFLYGKNQGWLTAEYAMLPRATGERVRREVTSGKPSGRTQEIQRLIGRSLRAALDLKKLGERQIIIDCDVLQADGGTRTAAINGGFVALSLALKKLAQENILKQDPLVKKIAAISCGMWQDEAIVDLDYLEDSNIDVDANFVLTDANEIVEIQASAEGGVFSKNDFAKMHNLAEQACQQIFKLQDAALAASK